MPDTARKFSRESPDRRRADLIAATLRVIAHAGMDAATVRAIAEEACVTQGLIRHHFRSKDDLIAAAYETHQSSMTAAASAAVAAAGPLPDARLAAFVAATLSPPVAGAEPLAVWAGFLPQLRRNGAMAAIHARTNGAYRDVLGALLRDMLRAAGGRMPDDATLNSRTVLCGCLLDGLWMEAGLLPGDHAGGALTRHALRAIALHLGLDDQAH